MITDRRAGLLQHPEPVRRLRPRQAVRPRRPGPAELRRRRLPREVADQRAGDGPARVVRRQHHLLGQPGRRRAEARPGGEPPAERRRRQRVPRRPRLRAGGHGPRRQRQGGLPRDRWCSCRRTARSRRSAWSRRRTPRPSSSASRGSSCRRTASPASADPFSQFPEALDPVLSLVPYPGDLGLDDGRPQSVYALDKTGLKPFASDDASLGRDQADQARPRPDACSCPTGWGRSASTACSAGSSCRSATAPARASRWWACCWRSSG